MEPSSRGAIDDGAKDVREQRKLRKEATAGHLTAAERRQSPPPIAAPRQKPEPEPGPPLT
jgi:hypothetical protein